jgi:ribosomal protein L11 methyltransferase
MYLWRRRASRRWVEANEEKVRAGAGAQLAIIEQAGRKQLQLQVAGKSRTALRRLVSEFGGRVGKLPRDWLERSSRDQKSRPLKIGARLVVLRSRPEPGANRVPCSPKTLIIPAGTAFGTGEHATTAMSVRLLEHETRNLQRRWSLCDLGTGTGILALAAKRLGADRVLGIDLDPIAVSTAKQNAQLNNIRGVEFRMADVTRWKPTEKFDIITANLFSDLLLEILATLRAQLRPNGCLILSGIMRDQEQALMRPLHANKIGVVQVRRRGKWVALLAKFS